MVHPWNTRETGSAQSVPDRPVDREADPFALPTVEVVMPSDAQGIAAVQELWRDYWQLQGWPPERDHFTEELHALPGLYGPPDGALILVRAGGAPAGTVAIRPVDVPGQGRVCEGKRMFVSPQFRRQGVAERLVQAAIDEAEKRGYEALYAEVLQGMDAALALYRKAGFVDAESYSPEPAPDGIALRRDLSTQRAFFSS